MEKYLKVGIPKALFYWKRPYFWETFFEKLGFKIVFSPPTNKEIVENGVREADPETCFSMKVFYGHLISLERKVDFIFLPRLKKNELGLEYCPKFFGLPDLASIFIKTPIISPQVDLKKETLENTLIKLGRKIGKEKNLIKKAFEEASFFEERKKEEVHKEYLKKIQSSKKKIVLISHPYNLFDEYVNLRIKKKIKDLGGEPIFIGEIPNNEAEGQGSEVQIQTMPQFHWEFGEEISQKIKEILKHNIVGAIEISSFQCGCDAVLKEFVEREFKNANIPFLYLLIDEHTGEAGLQTRLEAFFDTLREPVEIKITRG